jgi:hypothetical protein
MAQKMKTLTMTALMCFGFGVIMLLIHVLGIISSDGSILFAGALSFAIGLTLLAVSALTGKLSKVKMNEDIELFHSELEEFLKSNGTGTNA